MGAAHSKSQSVKASFDGEVMEVDQEIWGVLDELEDTRKRRPGEIMILEYANKYGISRKTARRRLDALVERGRLYKREARGGPRSGGRFFYYGVNK